MPYKTYSEKLKDPRWQKKRLEILEAHDWTCEFCNTTSETLHVHHGYYERGLDPWEYDSDTLFCLCSACHSRIEEKLKCMRRCAGSVRPEWVDMLWGYAAGLNALCVENGVIVSESWEFSAGLADAFRLEHLIVESMAGRSDRKVSIADLHKESNREDNG